MRSIITAALAVYFSLAAKAKNIRDQQVRSLAKAIIAFNAKNKGKENKEIRVEFVETLRDSLKAGAEKRGYSEKSVVNHLTEAQRIVRGVSGKTVDISAKKFLAGNLSYVQFLAAQPAKDAKPAKRAAKKPMSRTDLKSAIRTRVANAADAKAEVTNLIAFLKSL